MVAHHGDSLPNRVDALEVLLNALGLLWKMRLARRNRGIEPARHHEGFIEQRASHLMQVTDIDERDIAIDAKRAQKQRPPENQRFPFSIFRGVISSGRSR